MQREYSFWGSWEKDLGEAGIVDKGRERASGAQCAGGGYRAEARAYGVRAAVGVRVPPPGGGEDRKIQAGHAATDIEPLVEPAVEAVASGTIKPCTRDCRAASGWANGERGARPDEDGASAGPL